MEESEFERKIQQLIDEVLELRKSWEQRRVEAENQVKFLDAKLANYQNTLKDYWEYMDRPPRGRRRKDSE
jgi:hypothetical protein